MTQLQNTETRQTRHVTLIVRNLWNAEVESIDIPDYIDGQATGYNENLYETIDIIVWPV